MGVFSNELKAVLNIMAKRYLNENPEMFNLQEKQRFVEYLNEFLNQNDMSQGVRDEVCDFLVFTKLFNLKPRHEEFANYVIKKYGKLGSRRVLDVGAGRTCKLANPLIDAGFTYSAIDPNIRLEEENAMELGFQSIQKDFFYCKEFAPNGKATDVKDIDLLVALEPCLGAEHVIRRGLEEGIPFEILLCYENHNALNGQKFRTPEEWFEHLQKISSEVRIEKLHDGYHASGSERKL